MSRNATKSFWVIQGYDSTTKLFEHRIGVGQITDQKLRELILALTAKISLTEEEMVRNYAKKRTKAHSSFLEITRIQGDKIGYSCGTNPYVIVFCEDSRADL